MHTIAEAFACVATPLVLVACAPAPVPAAPSSRIAPPTAPFAPTAPVAVAPPPAPPPVVASAPPAPPPPVSGAAPSLPLAGTTKQICAAAARLAPSAADQPTPEEIKSLHGCDAEALYYGIGAQPDPALARKCAYAQIARDEGAVFGGQAILMMIYANGKGVRPWPEGAIHFACDVDAAPAEREGRVSHLVQRSRRAEPGKDFDLCDDITSGFMDGHCTAHAERIAATQRSQRKAKAVAGLPGPEMIALDDAAKAYFDARERNEVDLSGTSRAAFAIRERATLEEGYVGALERVHDPHFPPQAGTAKSADAALNAVFKRLMATPKGAAGMGTVTADGIRATERTWIPYRDAWVALGTKVRPDVPADAWKAWLTGERLAMLRDLAAN